MAESARSGACGLGVHRPRDLCAVCRNPGERANKQTPGIRLALLMSN